jgi:UDP-N-acetylglucosamine acyltransferase
MVQKSPTAWLPRFWRKPDAVMPLDDHNDSTPLDDRLPPGPSLAASMSVSAAPLRPVMASVMPTVELGDAPKIHPLACVDRSAILAPGVEIGPFCVVGPNVKLGRGTRLMNNVTVVGHTTIGDNNLLFPNSVLGAQPQDKKFNGEPTRLEVGDNNHFREAVTIHLGTGKGGGLTRIGSNNLLMVNTHIGHDVMVGDNCIFANNVMFAGHVHVGNNVVLSGAAGVHHFVTIGDFVYAGGQAKISHDVPPFVKVDDANKIRGTNSVGLRRNGFTELDVSAIEQTIWKLFLDRDREPVNATLRKMRAGACPELTGNSHVGRVLEFLERRNLGRHGRYLESLRAG